MCIKLTVTVVCQPRLHETFTNTGIIGYKSHSLQFNNYMELNFFLPGICTCILDMIALEIHKTWNLLQGDSPKSTNIPIVIASLLYLFVMSCLTSVILLLVNKHIPSFLNLHDKVKVPADHDRTHPVYTAHAQDLDHCTDCLCGQLEYFLISEDVPGSIVVSPATGDIFVNYSAQGNCWKRYLYHISMLSLWANLLMVLD